MMHRISSVIILAVAMFSIFPCGNATLICNKLFGAEVHHWRKIKRISQTSGKKLLSIVKNLKDPKILILWHIFIKISLYFINLRMIFSYFNDFTFVKKPSRAYDRTTTHQT